jgi:hypothetical protein
MRYLVSFTDSPAGVTLLCTILYKIDKTFADLPERVSPEGVRSRLIDVDIVMVPSGNAVEFAMYFQGRLLPHV